MPAKNPRLSIVLPPNVMTTLARLAALQRRSRAAVAREFLIEVEPVLSRVASMLELAAKAQGEWPKEFVSALERQQEELEKHALEAIGQMDAFSDVLAAHVAGRGAEMASRGPVKAQETRKHGRAK